MRSPALLLLAATLAAETAFLLPHAWQDARHRIFRLIGDGETELVVITQTLDDPSLRRALKKALGKARPIRLLTPSAESAAAWAPYRNMEVCLLPNSGPEPLGFSLIAASEGEACFLSLPLSRVQFQSHAGIMHCSESGEYRKVIETLRNECTPYFR